PFCFIGSNSQKYTVPGPVWSFDQISMPSPLDGVRPIFGQMPLGKYWVCGCRSIRPGDMVTRKYHFAMITTGPPFGTHQVIFTRFVVQMGALYPNRIFRRIYTAIDNNPVSAFDNLVGLTIIFPEFDHTMSFIALPTFVRSVIVQHIGFSIVIKKQGRVNSVKIE